MTKKEYLNKMIEFNMRIGLIKFMCGRGYFDYIYANDRITKIEIAIEELKKIGYNEQG